MATDPKIVYTSFRVGCGRYIQEKGAVSRVASEIRRLGCKKPFVIGDATAFGIAKEKIEKSLSECGFEATFYLYDGFCNPRVCDEIRASEAFAASDIVVGVGGGNIMDAAKYCAYGDLSDMRKCLEVPTSSATCAATTPLSVLYDDRGAYIKSHHYPVEISGVIADMDIIAAEPRRLMVSGVLDAVAKLPELSQRLSGRTPAETDAGLYASAELSRFLFNRLFELLPAAFEGKDEKAVYDTVYYTVCLTGVVSGLARGSNQSAIAHKIYENSRSLYPAEVYKYLHGEIVAVGLITQMKYNALCGITGEAAEPEKLKAVMKKYGMPVTLGELGVPATEESFEKYYSKIVNSSAMAGTGDAEKEYFREALKEVF